MNERIKALAYEAAIFAEVAYAKQTMATFDTNRSTQELYEEKFAELIVRECMNVGNDLAKETFSYSTQPGDIFEYKAHAMEDVVEAIKDHFGVEE